MRSSRWFRGRISTVSRCEFRFVSLFLFSFSVYILQSGLGLGRDRCDNRCFTFSMTREIDDLCRETDDLIDRLEKIHEEYHNDLEATTKSAVRRADDINDLGSALKEHEIALHKSIRAISRQLEQGVRQMRSQLLKTGQETGPKKYHQPTLDCIDSIKRKAELLEGKLRQNLERRSELPGLGLVP